MLGTRTINCLLNMLEKLMTLLPRLMHNILTKEPASPHQISGTQVNDAQQMYGRGHEHILSQTADQPQKLLAEAMGSCYTVNWEYRGCLQVYIRMDWKMSIKCHLKLHLFQRNGESTVPSSLSGPWGLLDWPRRWEDDNGYGNKRKLTS